MTDKKKTTKKMGKRAIYDLSVLQPQLNPQSQEEFSFSDVFGMLKRRRYFIFGFLIVCVAVACYLYHITPNTYRCRATFTVSYRNPEFLVNSSSNISTRNVDEKFMNTVVALLQSDKVMVETWKTLDESPEKKQLIKTIDFSKGPLLGSKKILSKISAKVGGDGEYKKANIVQVTYLSPDSLEAAIILDEAITQFNNYFRSQYQRSATDIESTVQSGLDEIEESIASANDDLQKFIQNSPAVYMGDRTNNNYLTKLQELETKQVEIDMNVLIYENRLKQVEEMVGGRTTSDIPTDEIVSILSSCDEGEQFVRAIIDMAQGSRQEDSLKAMMISAAMNIEVEKTVDIMTRMAELRKNYGENSPQIQNLQNNLDELKRVKKEVLGFPENGLKTENKIGVFTYDKILEIYIDVLKKRINVLTEQQKEINSYIALQNDKVRDIIQFYETIDMKKLSIVSQQDVYSNLGKKLDELSLLKNYGGYEIEIIEPAIERKTPVAPSLWFNLLLAVGLGLFFGSFFAIVLDLVDTTFRTPLEVQNRLGVPLLMQIPNIHHSSKRFKNVETEPGRPAPSMVSYYSANTPQNEIFRRLRTIVQTSVLNPGLKTLQFTSAFPDDGKSFLICNLAIALANAGLKVLLIDADLRKPDVHKLFTLENGVGFNELLSGSNSLEEVTRTTKVANLSIIVGGKPRRNSAELLATPMLEQKLNEVKELYDIVLIDAPPVLLVSDAAIIAAKVDRVIYCTRIRKHDRAASVQGIGVLQGVEANILGCIVNCFKKHRFYNEFAAPKDQHGYGYGYGSRYGYGYGSRYGYGAYSNYGYGSGYGYGYGCGYGSRYGYGDSDDSPDSDSDSKRRD